MPTSLSNRLFRNVRLFLFAAITLATGCAVGVAPERVFGDEPSPHELQLTTERVVVFKDGYYLVVKHGTALADKDGDIFCDDVPDAAVLGSFWATTEKGRIVSMTAGWETIHKTIEKEVSCTQPLDLLLANVGQTARVELNDKTAFNGEIREVLVEETHGGVPESLRTTFGLPAFPNDPEASSGIAALSSRKKVPPREATTAVMTTLTGSQFVLRTEDGDVLLPVAQIRTLTIKEMRTTQRRSITTTERTKRLTLRFDEPGKRRDVTLMYFRPGLRWIPTYRVGLSPDEGKKMATVALQAEFLNEAEDLQDVPIDIVVGVPNFRFRDTPSPLVLEQVLRNTLQQAAPQLMGQQALSNGFVNSSYGLRSGETRRGGAGPGGDAEGGSLQIPDDLTSGGAQDLFVYSLPKTSLAKGQRAALSIFTAEVPYRDVYTWDLHVARADIDAAPAGAGLKSPLNISQNRVWHQIVLTNTTKLPWTTGAVLMMQGSQPLAQELLTYTSPKDDVRVPVTVAVDVRGSYTEKETARKLNDLTFDGYQYARINKQGSLNVCNHKSVQVDLEITFRVGGRADETTLDGRVTLGAYEATDWHNYRGSPAVNNSSTVFWNVKLKPGDTFEPSVVYHYHTRH